MRSAWCVIGKPAVRLSALMVFVLLVGACAEKQDGGKVCPALCPEQSVPTLDTVIEDVGATAVVSPYPARGSESWLLLAARGDSLDARAVIRFDTIPARYLLSEADTTTSPITFVDSAELRLRLDTAGAKATKPVTVTLYNVDTTASDTSTAALAALFRPDRQIGTATFDTAKLKDTLRIGIDTAFLRQRIVARQRVRIGVQVTSSESVQLHVLSSLTERGPQLLFDPSPETTTKTGSYRPVSLTPTDNETLARDLSDFTLLVDGTDDPTEVLPAGVLRLGGLPARRVYLRFDLPERIVDSGTVLRATLTLTQIPVTRLDAADKVTVYAHASLASAVVTDPAKVALLIGNATDSAQVTPNGAGVIELDLVRLFRRWKNTKPADQPRVIILRTSSEGRGPAELRVHDVTTASGLRPRLRITYVPRVDFGLP